MNKTYSTPEIYKEYLEKTGDKSISRGDFAKIIYAFNKKIAQAIIEKGYVFNMFASTLLSIMLKRRNFERMAAKFGESNKKKQEIIDRGGTPLEYYKDEEGNIIGDNGGEAWMIYDVRSFFTQVAFGKGKEGRVYSKKLNLYKWKTIRSFNRAKEAFEREAGETKVKLLYTRI